MFPITVEIKGRIEPIDAVKIAYGDYLGEVMCHLVTPDGRIITFLKKDLLVFCNNTPSKESLDHVDRLIREGKALEEQTPRKYAGNEVQ